MTLTEVLELKKKAFMLKNSNIGIIPSSIYLTLLNSKNYTLIAEDVSYYESTGNIMPESLTSIGVYNTIIGHRDLHDTYQKKVNKLVKALESNMHVYLIISDTKEDFDYQYTTSKLASEIRGILSKINSSKYSNITFIYYPNWANEPLKVEAIENILYQLKLEIKNEFKHEFAFYYGSVFNKNNLYQYYDNKNIDGLFVDNGLLNEIIKK